VTTVLDRLQVTRIDAVLAVSFVVAGLAQALVWPIAPGGIGELYVVGSMLPLAWRRTRPVESALVSSAFWLVPLDGYPVLGFVAVILQFFALGDRGAPRIAVVLTTVWASMTAVIGTLLGPENPVAAIGAVLVVVAPVLAGRLVGHLRRQNAELAELARQLRQERRRAEEAAVGVERGRIAQELHDVVGHEVTLIAIQAEAAAAALRVRPERALEPVEAIRTTAHRALAEIRGVLGVLDPPDQDGAGLSDGIAELSRRAREAGIDNTVEVSGTPGPEHAPASMAVNRIIRECLTNAGRHAPGQPVDLHVDWGPDQVVIGASNPAPGRLAIRPGRGITGMRNRAALLGGTFESECTDGTFRVAVRLPVTTRDPS
jgi:signal transduction histidine kinase